MASIFLMSNDGANVITLDVITEATKSRSNTLTKSSVMSGASASDGYNIGNFVTTLQGVVTSNKIGSLQGTTNPDPLDFQKQLSDLEENYTRFTLYGNALLPTVPDCVITNSTVTVNKYLDTVEVTLTIEQVFVADKATKSIIIEPNKSSKPEISSKDEEGNGTKGQKDVNTSKTLFRRLADQGIDVSTALLGSEGETL